MEPAKSDVGQEVPDSSPSSLPASFAVTYDYRCPFARNVHEHLVEALKAGARWDVQFLPFSLSQVHVEEGGTAVWDNPDKNRDLLAMEASIVVAERFAHRFADVHVALFGARHDDGRDLREPDVVADVLDNTGVNAEAVFDAVAEGWPREAFRKAHEQARAEHHVFGVPTFVVGDAAVFVRIMTRPAGDGALARSTIEHVLELITGRSELNEFKHTTIAR
jgi:predicted DsbA family dithiol-disulfide isomerase